MWPDHISVFSCSPADDDASPCCCCCRTISTSNAPRRGTIEPSPLMLRVATAATVSGSRAHSSVKNSVALRRKTCQDLHASMATVNLGGVALVTDFLPFTFNGVTISGYLTAISACFIINGFFSGKFLGYIFFYSYNLTFFFVAAVVVEFALLIVAFICSAIRLEDGMDWIN